MKKQHVVTLLFLMLSTSLFAQKTFTLSSKDLGGQGTKRMEFNGFGCAGLNQSPQLSWENAPEGTQSFAITMYDPDAPTGSGFWHWVVFDIPGIKGFGGPCPPEGHGYHQYIFTIYALKTKTLGLDSNVHPALVGFNLWNQTLAKASIVAYYKR